MAGRPSSGGRLLAAAGHSGMGIRNDLTRDDVDHGARGETEPHGSTGSTPSAVAGPAGWR